MYAYWQLSTKRVLLILIMSSFFYAIEKGVIFDTLTPNIGHFFVFFFLVEKITAFDTDYNIVLLHKLRSYE